MRLFKILNKKVNRFKSMVIKINKLAKKDLNKFLNFLIQALWIKRDFYNPRHKRKSMIENMRYNFSQNEFIRQRNANFT